MKANVGFHQGFARKNWLTIVKAKETETIKQAPTPAQPAKVSATQSSVALPQERFASVSILFT